MTNLDKSLGRFLNIPVELDGWDNIKYSGKQRIPDPYTYKSAIGLSIEE